MVTKTGDKRIYDEFSLACATNKADPKDENVMLVFTEQDNQTQHMFQVTKDKARQYANMILQTCEGKKIEIAPASALADLSKGRK